MKVSELRAMLKGIKGTEDIIIGVPCDKGTYMYPHFHIAHNKNLESYNLIVND